MSLFGARTSDKKQVKKEEPAAAAAPMAAGKPTEKKPATGGFSLFGGGKKEKAPKPVAAKAEVSSKAASKAASKPSKAPAGGSAKEKAKPVAVTKDSTPASLAAETSARFLTKFAKTSIAENSKGPQQAAKALVGIDDSVAAFVDGRLSSANLYADIVKLMGSKDAAFDVIPDVIGSIPRGPAKSEFNQFFQQKAS
jgi:hypothetical protein